MKREERGVPEATATWILVSQEFDKEIKRMEDIRSKHASNSDLSTIAIETMVIESVKKLKHKCYCAAMGVKE